MSNEMLKQDTQEFEYNDKLKDIVFKFVNPSSNNISATALVNILSEIYKSEEPSKANEQLEKLNKIEKNLEAIRAKSGNNLSKIQALQTTIDSLRETIKKSDDALHSRIDDVIEHYDYRMDKLEKLAILQLNNRERRDRSFSIKVHQYADYSREDGEPPKVKHIYERILKPCLEDACRNGEIDEVPAIRYKFGPKI